MHLSQLHPHELDWIRSLHQSVKSPLMDRFFYGWDFVDSLGFALFVVSIVWYLIDRRIGIRLLYILALSAVINKTLKEFFGMPRPCQIEATLGLICPGSPGFPSGAAQSAIIYAGILFIECKRWLYRILGAIFALLLCFSRIYLGVHFFTDILGGLIVGGALLLIYKYLLSFLEKDCTKYTLLFPFLLVAIGHGWAVFQFVLFVGITAGLLCAERFKIPSRRKVLQWLSVVVGGFVCLFGADFFPVYKLAFAIVAGFWFSFFGAWIVSAKNSLF